MKITASEKQLILDRRVTAEEENDWSDLDEVTALVSQSNIHIERFNKSIRKANFYAKKKGINQVAKILKPLANESKKLTQSIIKAGKEIQKI